MCSFRSCLVAALALGVSAWAPTPMRAGRAIHTTHTMSASAFANLPASVKPGVVTGQALSDLLQYAKDTGFAIPAVNCVSTSGINACLEAAKKIGGPTIIQFSRGGGQFYAGKAADNTNDRAAIAGCVAVRLYAMLYPNLA